MSNIATIKSEIADLQAKARAHRNSHNDGGYGYNPYDSKVDSAIAELRQAELADYVARWPEIKAAWNSAVSKYAGPKGVNVADMPKIEAAAGISYDDIKNVKSIVEG